jgi:SWI/SNF-related matrix-associated actin-dependent regulator 1 of chromatin subfamily A
MPSLFPHQIEGATFLASRSAALLADEQRVGKTAAAIRACDYVMAHKILVVTTASARAQWGREFREWGFPRDVQVVFKSSERIRPEADVVVVAWSMVGTMQPDLAARGPWDVLLLDESHAAKNPTAKRTRAVFNTDQTAPPNGLFTSARRVWCLSGTPVPNSPADMWPMLNALDPGCAGGLTYDEFIARYCVVKPVRYGNTVRDVIKGGKNLEELNERVKGFWLRRTQKDVGIQPPIFSVFALTVDKLPPELRDDPEAQAVLDAWETGETKSLEMHLGPIRRLTGHMKAHAVVAAAKEMLEDGQIDKLVLMAWHVDVLDILWTGLAEFGVTGIDGRTGAKTRDAAVKYFNRRTGPRVFVGQITAAGEAIDLSAAAELWFVESSFVPKDMSQAAMRITNHSQKRQALVRVCALAGSIDEALQAILTRKVASIRQLMEPTNS